MTKSGEQERVMPKSDEPENVPTQDKARQRDPLWIAVNNLGTNVGEHGRRIEKVEEVADKAHALAETAASKVDAKVAREVAFASSFNRLTGIVGVSVLVNVLMLLVLVFLVARR